MIDWGYHQRHDYDWYNYWIHNDMYPDNFRRYLDTMISTHGEIIVRLWVDWIPTGIYTHQEWI